VDAAQARSERVQRLTRISPTRTRYFTEEIFHGLLARFVPVVRTFAPVVAGVSKMHYRTFVMFNVIGGILWGVGVTTLGYFLGNIEFIKDNLEIAAIIIVLISILPMLIEYWRHRRAAPGTIEAEESIVLD